MRRSRATVAILALLAGSLVALGGGTVTAPPAVAAEPAVETLAQGAPGIVWAITFAPDGRYFYSIRQTGEIFAGRRGQGNVRIARLPSCACGEGGLMGLATSPTFDRDGLLYAMYTYRESGRIGNRIVRLKVSGNSAAVDGTVISGLPGGTTHDGGRLRFGPDGMLFATIGDTRRNPNPAQDTRILAGKILRLDPRGGAAAGNPYGNAVWSYGHRNPQGLDFREDRQLFAVEHGPGCRDELNRIVRGGNFGWTGNEGCPPPLPRGSEAAVKLYTPTSTIAPSGASFYTSPQIPAWTGSLFFTTLKTQTLYRVLLSEDGRSVRTEEQLFKGRFGRMRDVQQGPDGGLWLTTDDGRVLRIPPQQAAPPSSGCTKATVNPVENPLIATLSGESRMTAVPGSVVDLFAYTRPSTAYRLVRTVRMPASGSAPVFLRPPGNTRMYAQQRGCPVGPSRVLDVQTAITLLAVHNGTRNYTFYGDSVPARPGGLIVTLYRIDASGREVITKQTRADARNGEWRMDRTFTGTGRFGFVVRTGQDLQNAPGRSNVRPTAIF